MNRKSTIDIFIEQYSAEVAFLEDRREKVVAYIETLSETATEAELKELNDKVSELDSKIHALKEDINTFIKNYDLPNPLIS